MVSQRRSGLTLIELLAFIAILSLMLAILLPAIQAARETGRRVQCVSQLRQLALGAQTYHDAWGAFPPGGDPHGFSMFAAMLPQLEYQSVFDSIDFRADEWGPINNPKIQICLPLFQCPSDGASRSRPAANFAGNFGTGVLGFGYNGVYRPLAGNPLIGESPKTPYLITAGSVTDGLSNTAAISELLVADGSEDVHRVIWETAVFQPNLIAFAETCAAIQGSAPADASSRGSNWASGQILTTGYTHILPPGSNSCSNAGVAQDGAYAAVSNHRGGVNVAYADAHVAFTINEISANIWRALGSRNGGESGL